MNRKLGKYKTTQNLSSETLFHLTNNLNILELILNGGFQARWIYEKLPGTKLAYFTKTVCFCDIPLGLIKEHVNWYGAYGIGVKRSDSKVKGLSPVLYVHSKSPKFPRGSSPKTLNWYQNFEFTGYIKQVRGKQMFFNEDESTYFKWKTFYNEKEWRYFPPDKTVKVVKYEKEIQLENQRINLNKADLPILEIDPCWIEYIIIEDSKDIESLIKILKNQKYENHFESLLTKVITCKQIQKDF